MIAIAEKLDAKLLRCVIDDNGYEPDLERDYNNAEKCPSVLEEKDIVLGIENHDRFKSRGICLYNGTAGQPPLWNC